jgi:hypothetical protein
MQEFLENLFGDELPAELRIAVFTTPDRRTYFFDDYQAVEQAARKQSATQNVYFGLGLIRGKPRGRGKLVDVAGIGALWCDIDVSSTAHPKQNLPQTIDEAQTLLDSMPLAPSIVVGSGHGLHGYWLFKEPWIFENDEERSRAASLAKRWHGIVCELAARHGWALENLGDLTRVLRLPKTFNHNGPGLPLPVQILKRDWSLRYLAEDFEQFLPEDKSAVETPCPVGDLQLKPDANPPAEKLLDLAGASPSFWDTWHRKRSDLADPSQSSCDLSIATIAALNGWTDQEIADLLIAVRRKHGLKPEKALRDAYVRRTIAKARLAAQENASPGGDVDLSKLLGKSAESFSPHANVQVLEEVDRQELEWLWPGRVPLGKLTLLAGDPGLGKSFVTLDMAARISRGDAWPDVPLLKQSPAGVILFNAEDDLSDTIAPRLDRLGADSRRIVAVEGVTSGGQQRHFSLEQDLPRLEEVLRDFPETKLIVIDPIAAYCGKVDSHKNTDVRGLLAPLAQLASRFQVAVVAVTHLSKSGGTKAVYRAMGSLAFAAAARAVWAITKDSNDPNRRLFLPAKLNLAQDPAGMAYAIKEGRVEWESDPVKMHADDAFAAEAAAAEPKRGRSSSERREASEWLEETLRGRWMPTVEVLELGKQYDFSERTLRRAFKALNGASKKESFGGPWMWGLSNDSENEDGQLF